ncbi:uncharacterized protein LOC105423122 isoform X1 [Pogonomyrmex barbatus]|uniref:Uncharacterized protein LOC105423122 isoform X1 n=1 Tax=Pogonomyrmex barbatus TaxID=144034 RepID=A0A6I9VVZ4_9HYME|nr:uncharacterized protein LOC105423122 isoform X1 [Pogonomyrmex barbatus]XP_011631074.1 uncharacterized protein LOC105423122 isoform X1 [Pogonomyrmex barbatus]
MLKYHNLRPAGMSDDEEDDDDDVFFPLEKNIEEHDYISKKNSMEEKRRAIDFNQTNDEARIFENHVLKACAMGYLEVIEEYLEKHDINNFLHTGWTLLLYAASSVESKVVEYLLARDANPNKHRDGFTPLMALCNSTKGIPKKSLKCLELLIQAKADANITNKRRETALMYACKTQDAEFVTELIKYVQNINSCDSDGKTALIYAVIANKPDIVRILLEHNVNTSVTDVNNLSAKDIANTKGFTEISVLLTRTKDKEETIVKMCEIFQITTWRDLFPNVCLQKKKFLDHDILVMLFGMGLEKYNTLFQGMDIRTFLQLTEDDLCHLGIDITVHRDQFLECLDKFHNKKWRVNSFGKIKKSSYTIYDGVISLGNVTRQIGIIVSSFQYVKNNLLKAASENIYLSPTIRIQYEEELRKTQKTMKLLKNEIIQMKKLAQKIDKKNSIGIPPTWIGPEKSKFVWTTIGITLTSVTLIVGLYLCKRIYIQKLWSMYNIKI